jgi:hypothetical protein
MAAISGGASAHSKAGVGEHTLTPSAEVNTNTALLSEMQEDDRISIETSDSYDGLSEDGDQAIEVEVTLTAQETTSNLTVDFQNTQNTFIVSESFEVTVSNVEFEQTGPTTYEVRELDADQSITFTFQVYPRVLDQATTEAYRVGLDAGNPQTYERSETYSVDLSSSPYLAYQSTPATSNDGPPWALIAISIAAVLGFATAGYTRFVALPNAASESEDELRSAFDDLEREISDRASLNKVEEVRDEYIDDDFVEIDEDFEDL